MNEEMNKLMRTLLAEETSPKNNLRSCFGHGGLVQVYTGTSYLTMRCTRARTAKIVPAVRFEK
jgi:hypothetical protein